MWRAIALLTLLALLAACASGSGQSAQRNRQTLQDQEDLARSGFRMEMLDTPEKFARARELPQRKVVERAIGPDRFYVYADITLCGCIYTGDQAAYARYRRRLQERSIRGTNQRAKDLETESFGANSGITRER